MIDEHNTHTSSNFELEMVVHSRNGPGVCARLISFFLAKIMEIDDDKDDGLQALLATLPIILCRTLPKCDEGRSMID